MKSILLVGPMPLKFELANYAAVLTLPSLKAKSFMVPLHIATIAALTPDEFEVDLWDESVHGRIDDSTNLKDYNLVGITGFTAHLPRAKEIARVFQKRRIPVAVGGSGVSAAPEHYRGFFDILFLGEAELTWPQFLADWKTGSYRKQYRQVGNIDLALSPPPRWDSIADQMKNYLIGQVQTSRGCPFDCEFCDVGYLFGHRFRHKPIVQVLEEITTLEGLGMETIAFCDDNFIGNPRYAKELLRELIPLNNSFRRPLNFTTELSINVADDEELLELLADANIGEICIGIESPNKESLKETNKLQNYHRRNLIEDIKKIQSYGLPIRGTLIVGFDHDTPGIFDQHFQLVQEACIAVPGIGVLMAPPGTRLWSRLSKEGRLLKSEEGRYSGNPGASNIIPKKMTRAELLSGYLNLIEKVYDWENFAVRIKGFVSNVKRRPNVPKRKRQWKRLFQFVYFLFSYLDRKTRGVILDIIRHTRQQAPFMMPKVVGRIMRHYGYAARHQFREAIQSQMNQEESGEFKLEIQQGGPLVLESFKEPYQRIFPEIYEEVYQGVVDKTRTEEALIEVFVDFITRWGETMDSFSDQHKVFLHELVDRTIARENGTVGTQPPIPIEADEAVPDVKKTGLAEEILKAVEQELRR